MGRCLKVIYLLIEKKIAEIKGDNLKSWEYEGMIKRHIEKCPSCRKFLEGMYEKSKISDADFSQSPIGAMSRSSPLCKDDQGSEFSLKRGK